MTHISNTKRHQNCVERLIAASKTNVQYVITTGVIRHQCLLHYVLTSFVVRHQSLLQYVITTGVVRHQSVPMPPSARDQIRAR